MLGALLERSRDKNTSAYVEKQKQGEAWPTDFGSGPLGNVVSQIIESAARTPSLTEDTAKLDDKASASLQRWSTRTQEELHAIIADAAILSYDETGRLFHSQKTDGFLKLRLFPLLDRWDAQLGAVTPEHQPKESLGAVATRILTRMRCGLLLWLKHQGITPNLPQHEPFFETHHHAQSRVPRGERPAGQVVGVVRSGYLRDGAVFRRAHVVVTK